MLEECGEKGILLHCCWECKLGPTMVNIVKVLQNIKSRATIWSCNPTPGHVSGEKHDPKGCMHPSVHCSAVYNDQDIEATWMAIDRGV